MAKKYKYASKNEAVVYESISEGKGKKPVNKILLGTYVEVVETKGRFIKVKTAGPDGWMREEDLSDDMGLKIFFIDVGQGDGSLMEIGDYKILIDGGPNDNIYNYLTKWQYAYDLSKGKQVHIDYLIISHFDMDHYKGLIELIKDTRFTFGEIIHAGILKYPTNDHGQDCGLGSLKSHQGKKYLTTLFNDFLTIDPNTLFNRDVTAFLAAYRAASSQGRVKKTRRVEAGDMLINEKIEKKEFQMEILAPFTEKIAGKETFRYFKDEGITINGHSLVIKVTFGKRTFLLAGDLNSESEDYLLEKYSNINPFEVDVAKSCHHGSSDFRVAYLKKVNPYATVISSGDNEGHAHPRADAIGCSGKYSKAERPLVFSTELARSTDIKADEILFGMINARCNGSQIFLAQMKEVKKPSDMWDSYEIEIDE